MFHTTSQQILHILSTAHVAMFFYPDDVVPILREDVRMDEKGKKSKSKSTEETWR